MALERTRELFFVFSAIPRQRHICATASSVSLGSWLTLDWDWSPRRVERREGEGEGVKVIFKSRIPDLFGTCGCNAVSNRTSFTKVGYEVSMYTFALSFGFSKGQGYQRLRKAAVLYTVVYICQSQSPVHLIPLPPLGIHTFILYVCVSISALQISSSVSFF